MGRLNVRGVELELHPPPDYVSDVIRATGDFYEAAILDEILLRVSGGILVDVGAMIGNHTAYLQAFVPNDGIYAFEPLPANAALLRRNASPYGVFVHETALSDWEGEASLVVPDDTNLGHAMLSHGVAFHPHRPVRVRTLDSYRLPDVSLLKIDVEGEERQVLAGARGTIARWRPLVVIEDWAGTGYGDLLPGYRLAVSWEQAHQTFMYEPIGS